MGRHRPKNTHAANKVEKRLRKVRSLRPSLISLNLTPTHALVLLWLR